MSSANRHSLLALSALGVVYGDIGTSPLYAFKESFHHTHDLAVTQGTIFGILSLIFWSLILIVTIKYLVLIVRADNQGEGGVLALTTLITSGSPLTGKTLKVLSLLGIFGTALLYGDGMITPAISVLSAVEGLELVTPVFEPYIIPITIAILITLFSIQRYGTNAVGRVFGPITLLWFVTIGSLGLVQIFKTPEILSALNPIYAINFFQESGMKAFIVLGSVFLCVTGGEALYSDLGHFGKRPIRAAWFYVVLPCLILNYFGQGALLLNHPEYIKNPFYFLAPSWALAPLVCLATLATVIASQALITGVFSLAMQSVQLQYIPRIEISHTSANEIGQIYIRSVNFLLMISCILLVLVFKSSSNLAAAYGIAVTTTMVITTILFYFLARHVWKWSALLCIPLCGFFLTIEGAFWGANALKILNGGWFPLVIGVIIFTIMTTWHRGRQILSMRMLEIIVPLQVFIEKVKVKRPVRVKGIGIYMCGHPQYAPAPLSKNLKHFNSLHETLILLFVQFSKTPHIDHKERYTVEEAGENIYKVVIHYGFMELPNIPGVLKGIKIGNEKINLDEATFFLGREHLMATSRDGMLLWRERLFAFLSRNARPATQYFQLPVDKVMEIGSVIEL